MPCSRALPLILIRTPQNVRPFSQKGTTFCLPSQNWATCPARPHAHARGISDSLAAIWDVCRSKKRRHRPPGRRFSLAHMCAANSFSSLMIGGLHLTSLLRSLRAQQRNRRRQETWRPNRIRRAPVPTATHCHGTVGSAVSHPSCTHWVTVMPRAVFLRADGGREIPGLHGAFGADRIDSVTELDRLRLGFERDRELLPQVGVEDGAPDGPVAAFAGPDRGH